MATCRGKCKPQHSGFANLVVLLMLLTSSGLGVVKTASATTQLYENLTPGTTTTYTLAATDTSFIVRNVDIPGGHLIIYGPANGIVQPGVEILVEDCDCAAIRLFDADNAQLHLTGGATLTVRNNDGATIRIFYAGAGSTSKIQTVADSSIQIHGNTGTDLTFMHNYNTGANSYTQTGQSSLAIYGNTVTNDIIVFRCDASSTTTVTTTISNGPVSIYSNNAVSLWLWSDNGGGSIAATLSSQARVALYSNTLTSEMLVLRFSQPTGSSTLDVSTASILKFSDNTISSGMVVGLVQPIPVSASTYSFTVTMATSARIEFTGNNVGGTTQVFWAESGGSISLTGTTTSSIVFDTNTFTGFFFLFRGRSGSSLTASLTSSSIIVSGNTLSLVAGLFYVDGSSTTSGLTLASSSLVKFQNNGCSGSVDFIRADTSSSSTLSMSSASAIEVKDNSLPSASTDLHALYANGGSSTISATLSASCLIDFHTNTLSGGSVYLGLAESDGDVTISASLASVLGYLSNTVISSEEIEYGKILSGGTFSSSLATGSRLKQL